MNTRLNLTGLADMAHAERALKGKPLPIPLDDILPDPANPRNADDEDTRAAIEAQEELDADVAERGVKTPISVRPHPTIPSKYIINYGHRRYKSARNNRLTTIPAFVDECFDSYDQFNENELRTGLSTRARALFVKSRLDAGETKGEIAQRMRKKNQNFVTEHLALIDAPDCVNRAYAGGVTSARTLYDLRQAWDEFPKEIEAWCQQVPHITRGAIRDAVAGFRDGRTVVGNAKTGEIEGSSPHGFRHDEMPPRMSSPSAPAGHEEFRHDEKSPPPESSVPIGAPQFRHDEKVLRDRTQSKTAPATLKPLPYVDEVMVRYKGKTARVVQGAMVSIVLDGDDAPLEVPLSELVFPR
jgi:ParB family chromosome partitioning protein